MARKPKDPRELPDGAMQSAHWLGVTLFSIGDAVIATDTEARVTFLNPVAEELTGWSATDARGAPLEDVFEIINEETRQIVESPVVRALREGVIVGLANHTLLISKDGTERPIDDSAAPIRDENGKVAGVVLVFRDISERKRFERDLQESLEYCSNIIATLRESLVVLDEQLRVVSANDAFYRTFRASPEGTVGTLVYELGNGQWDIPRLRALLRDITRDDESFYDLEVEHEFPHIGQKVMLLNARKIHNQENGSGLILLAMEDVTDRRRAERRLSISEVRYRRLFESARDGILILDAKSMRIIDSNPFMHELLGYSHSQLDGRELWEIGLFSDKSGSQAAVRTLRGDGYVRYESLPLQSAHGELREVEFICNVYQEDGHEVAQCNIRDVTERKRMERQIQEQAKEMADASRRKDEFLAMLSHELRNPMAPIFNALQLIGGSGGENEIQRHARGVIDRQVRHLSRLVDDLLEVSRIATGRIHLHVERVTIQGIVERVVERSRPAIDRRQQELIVSVPGDVLWLEADAGRLEQTIGNLLDNASKYNDSGGSIWLTVEQEGEHAVVRVRDSGVGMSPDLVPHVFDLFTQADRSLSRSGGGLGIGLALVKSLVELHRGSVEARSDGEGKGAEVVVRLPVAPSAAGPEASQPATPRSTEPSTSLRVLVVDDNVDAARMCSMLLRTWGHDAREAHDGHEALRQAIDYLPHVVLLDIGLPGADGYQVARRLRSTPGLEGMRLLAVTGYGMDSDRRLAAQAGFDAHLTKPVAPDKLRSALADVLPGSFALPDTRS